MPVGCPEWLEPHHFHTWQEQGLIIWNNTDKKIVITQGAEALRLLNGLTSQEAWKSDGISITRLVHRDEGI